MLNWLKKCFWTTLPPEVIKAKQLLKAVDQGGIPLNPIKVNFIARSLGLEVSKSAPMKETIERIRRVTRKVAKDF